MQRFKQCKLIAVSGLKNSGKDTAANMLQYLLNAPDWAKNYWCYKHLNFLKNKQNGYHIRSFAYPLKKMLSALLNIPLEKFNDRDFKENTYVLFPKLHIERGEKIGPGFKLSDNKFAKMAKSLDISTTDYFLSIRQLMQFFGTNIMRTFFGDSLWTHATINNENLIISDLRFKVEMDVIKQNKGIGIFINRDSCIPGAHVSEQEVIEMKNQNKYDFIVDNNGSLKDLFAQLKNLVK